jgi:hypothetical protein
MIRSNIIALLSAAVFTGGVSAERSKKRKTHHYTQMTMKTLHLFWVLLLTAEVHAQDFKVSPIFADHMVLQREQDNKIWGYASKGSTRMPARESGASRCPLAMRADRLS